MNKRIIKYDNDIMGQRHGGKVDLSYGINNYSKDSENRNNYIINNKNKKWQSKIKFINKITKIYKSLSMVKRIICNENTISMGG